MKCPYCEKEIQDNSVFCYECGEQIYLSVEISDAAGIIASAVYWHMYSGNMENGDINRLKLAYMRLEDREIKGACEVFEKLLEENAENGWAHFGLFLADQMENGRGKFVPDIIYDNNSYTRGARFEGEQFKSIVDEAIKEVFYQSGLKAMKEIEEPQEYITIARTFRDKLDGYKDSGAQSRNCEYLYNKFFYDEYIAEAATADTEEKLLEISEALRALGDFEDAPRQAAELKNRGEALRNERLYTQASSDFAQKHFDRAAEVFGQLGGYKDSPELLRRCNREKEQQDTYDEAYRLMCEGTIEGYERAEALFARIKDYSDVVDKIAVCRQQKALVAENARKEQIYRKAQSAMGETDASLIKAIELFESIRDFRDSAQEIQKCQNILQKRAAQREAEAKAKEQGKKLAVLIPVIVVVFALAIVGFWAWSRLSNKPAPDTKTVAVKDNAPFAQAQKGGVIQFGHFKEQPIEWLVAEKENGKLLLIAKKALTGHAYSSGQCDWQTSGVRKWLNSDMLAAMFTPDEQKYLVEENGDKVFLFSRARADKYLSAESMLCKPTEYAKKNGAPAAANGCCDWWLKDLSGKMQGQALFVDSAGKVYDTPGGPVTETGGIRPAVWVNAE